MKNYKERFPNLYQLLSGYFHQDWVHVFDWKGQTPSYEAVVRYYKSSNPSSVVEKDTEELEEFLSLGLDEDAIYEAIRHEWQIAFRPAYINLTYKKWLENTLGILKEPMEKTKKEFIPDFDS